jgi:hypothetical protein
MDEHFRSDLPEGLAAWKHNNRTRICVAKSAGPMAINH